MQVVPPMSCGLDGPQARLTACGRHVHEASPATPEWREFGPLSSELLALSEWRVAQPGPGVAMESTGVYWQPSYPGLVGVVEVLVGKARERRPRPGHQTAPAEARW